MIKSILKELELDEKKYKPSLVHHVISLSKNNLVLPHDYQNDPEIQRKNRMRQLGSLGTIYTLYQQRCHTANAMDFDDLLVNTFLLFRDNPEIRQRWAQRFKFLLVDEYQDTNYVQQKIIEQLTQESDKVCVVGDDAQSIYAFRGAKIENILNFRKLFKHAKEFKLEQNYRSTQRIVSAANSLIKYNKRQIPKEVYSENRQGDPLQIHELYNDKEESKLVADIIAHNAKIENCKYNEFAILYRTNAQSRSFEDAFLREGIPYVIHGGLSFYDRKEIKDVTAYFRLVCNLDDEEALKRIINYPARGIGQATLDKIIQGATDHGVSLWTVCTNPASYGVIISSRTGKKLEQFIDMIYEFQSRLYIENAADLGTHIIKQSGVHEDLYSSTEPEALTRQENLMELQNALSQFVQDKTMESDAAEVDVEDLSLVHFLTEISLMTDNSRASH